MPPVANNQQSNVQQDSTFWSDAARQAGAVGGSLFRAGSGISDLRKNPLTGLATLATAYRPLQRGFPSTFTNPQQNPTMEAVNYYGGAAAAYGGVALSGLNTVDRFANRDIAGGLRGLQETYNRVRTELGYNLPDISNRAVDTGVNALGLVQGIVNKDVVGAGTSAAMLYNNAIDYNLINATPVSSDLIQGAGGAYNLFQGLRNRNYIQAGFGAGNLIDAGYNAFSGASLATPTVVSVGGKTMLAAPSTTAANSTSTGVTSGLGYLAAAYGAYNLVNMGLNAGKLSTSDTARSTLSGAASGAAVGTAFGGPGIGTALGALYGFALGATGSGKGAYQKIRDKYRESLIANNSKLFDKDYQGTLADGSKFNFELDGSTMKLDFENPLVKRGAMLGDILASAQGATGKAREAIATMFTKAAISNAKTEADVDKNMQHFMNQLGLDRSSAQAVLNDLRVSKKLDPEKYKVFSDQLKKNFKGEVKDPNIRELTDEEITKIQTQKKEFESVDKKIQSQLDDQYKKELAKEKEERRTVSTARRRRVQDLSPEELDKARKEFIANNPSLFSEEILAIVKPLPQPIKESGFRTKPLPITTPPYRTKPLIRDTK